MIEMLATIAICVFAVLALAGVAAAVWAALRASGDEGEPSSYRGSHRRARTRRARQAHALASKARLAVAQARQRAARQTVAERREAALRAKTDELRGIVWVSYETGELDRISETWSEVSV